MSIFVLVVGLPSASMRCVFFLFCFGFGFGCWFEEGYATRDIVLSDCPFWCVAGVWQLLL